MVDDVSLAIARAVERLADLQSGIRLKTADLWIGENTSMRDPGMLAAIERSRQAIEEMKAEKERAVLDLAALLSEWRGRS
jgi:hypothetical protein